MCTVPVATTTESVTFNKGRPQGRPFAFVETPPFIPTAMTVRQFRALPVTVVILFSQLVAADVFGEEDAFSAPTVKPQMMPAVTVFARSLPSLIACNCAELTVRDQEVVA